MFCKNCGRLINDGDKFCGNCGEKVETLPEFGFAQEPLSKTRESEKPKKSFHMEEFNWNLDGYPTEQTKPTEDIDFNWESVVEEKQRRLFVDKLESEHTPKAKEFIEPKAEEDLIDEKTLEEEIFGNLSQVHDEPTKIIEKSEKDNRVDKFYTYNEKNAVFQALLDQEYEKIQSGDEEEKSFEPLFRTEFVEEPEVVAEPEPVIEPEVVVEPEPVIEPELVVELEPTLEPEMAVEPEPTLESEMVVEPEYLGVALAQTPANVMASGGETNVEVPMVAEFPSEEEICPPSSTDKEEVEETGPHSKLTFDDVFSDNDDDDEDEEKPKKKNKALKVVAIVLCIFIAIELGIIGVMYFGKGTPLADKLNDGYLYMVNLISGEDKAAPSDNDEPVVTQSEIEKIIKVQSMYNKNIGTVEETTALTFDLNKDYGIEEISDTFSFSNSSWYTDDQGEVIYYGDEIIGTLIKYFSSWVDMANGRDEVVLDYIDDTSDLYEDIEAFTNKEKVEYGINKLEIGEIRNGSRGFYIMTAVAKVDSKTKKETIENSIVYMEPNNKTMKILNIYKF